MTKAIADVIYERNRQIEEEGWETWCDDELKKFELSKAAACYAAHVSDRYFKDEVPIGWPFTDKWWRPTTHRRNLVKAGALILAEIERLDRMERV